MNEKVYTVEDCLELCVGLKGHAKFSIESDDIGIMQSIARQVFKGTALTDRQHALMVEKLTKYKDQFTALEYDFDTAIDNVRQPLREIDRSKYIKIVGTQDVYDKLVYESHKQDWQWIKIRFPFSKKLILDLESVKAKIKSDQYVHHRSSHEHFFVFNEYNVFAVMEVFKDKDSFEIDETILEYYKKINDIVERKDEFVPGYFDGSLQNINPALQEIIDTEVLDKDNVLKYYDRRFRYGLQEFRHDFHDFNLAVKVASRDEAYYVSDPNQESMAQILNSIVKLDRFPLLVVCNERDAQQNLYEVFEYFKYNIPRETQSVLFRLDNADEESKEFNQFIKDKGLNNWVDKSTKIVYINNKLIKTLFKSEFKPIAALIHKDVLLNRQVDSYITHHCDLIITRDTQASPMRKYSRYYGR